MIRPHYNIELPVEFTPWISRSDPRFLPQGQTKTREIEIGRSEYSSVNRELILWLLERDLTVSAMRVFRSVPLDHYHLHRDLAPNQPEDTAVIKLNFVYHSWGSRMQWYRLKPGRTAGQWLNPSGVLSQHYSPKDCELVWDTECDSHCLINGGEIHTLKNTENQGQPRMAYSLVIQNYTRDLTWDQAVEIFKPWLD